MKYTPHNYQRRATQHIIDHPGAGLLVEAGLGKTVATATAIGLLELFGEVTRVLVVAPKRVAQHTWPAEFAKWDHLNDIEYAVAIGTPAQRRAAVHSRRLITLINYENLVWLTKQFDAGTWPFDMIVFDESTKMKSAGSVRWKALRAVLRSGRVQRTVILTGTPTPNGLLDLWAQVYLLDQGDRLGQTFWQYRQRWFESDYMGYNWTPRPHADEVIHDAVGDICLSMRAEDYLELPPLVPNRIMVDLPPAARAIYDSLEEDFYAELGREAITAATAAAKSNKLLQVCNGAVYEQDAQGHPLATWAEVHPAKLDALADLLEEADGPVLVAYTYQSDRDRLLSRFKQADLLKNSEDIDRWNRGKMPLALVHPASAGHGLNLQHGGHTLVWFGLNWSLELYQQFNARLHRQGQTRPVIAHHIIAADTVDELVLERLESKRSVQDVLMDSLNRIEEVA